jgi:hypothetical protein
MLKAMYETASLNSKRELPAFLWLSRYYLIILLKVNKNMPNYYDQLESLILRKDRNFSLMRAC